MEKLADHPLVRFLIICILVLILLGTCTSAFAEPLPNTLLREATYVGGSQCIHRKEMYVCHLVKWKGEMYSVVTRGREPRYVLKTINGKPAEVWRHDDVSI